MTELMMATFTEPETIQLLLEKCTRFIGDYCIALKKSGAQGVVIAEPAAGLVSNEDCSLYSSLYVRRIVELVQDDRFLVVLPQLRQYGALHRSHGRDRFGRLPLRQSGRDGRSAGSMSR